MFFFSLRRRNYILFLSSSSWKWNAHASFISSWKWMHRSTLYLHASHADIHRFNFSNRLNWQRMLMWTVKIKGNPQYQTFREKRRREKKSRLLIVPKSWTIRFIVKPIISTKITRIFRSESPFALFFEATRTPFAAQISRSLWIDQDQIPAIACVCNQRQWRELNFILILQKKSCYE